MKKQEINLEEVRKDHNKCPRFSSDNTHEAMICKTFYTAKKFTVGVSYWTEEEVIAGSRINSDFSRSVIVAPLYI